MKENQQAVIPVLRILDFNKAKEFYEKLGFSVIQEEDIDIGSGYYMNDYIMEKNISASLP